MLISVMALVHRSTPVFTKGLLLLVAVM
jgi:hypothetical protein